LTLVKTARHELCRRFSFLCGFSTVCVHWCLIARVVLFSFSPCIRLIFLWHFLRHVAPLLAVYSVTSDFTPCRVSAIPCNRKAGPVQPFCRSAIIGLDLAV